MISPLHRLGILGGGQLARMLALSAHEMGIQPWILSANPDDPAAQVTSNWHQGKLNSVKDLGRFLKNVEHVTFESEFVDIPVLNKITAPARPKIYPSCNLIATIQDRLSQKELLAESSLPSTDFLPVSSQQDVLRAAKKLGLPMVIKRRRFGYDGYGTFVVRSIADLDFFINEKIADQVGFIAERFIAFRRELAIMVFRSPKGEITHFPWVQSHQKDSRCDWVKGPLSESSTMTRLGRKIKTFLNDIQYVGALGVECFETKQGQILINELAPRVHNSGHYSMNALSHSQFELHIRCVFDLPLPRIHTRYGGFAMANLIGATGRSPRWNVLPSIHVHWYGKKDNRGGRKMGHINATGNSPRSALNQALKARKEFKL